MVRQSKQTVRNNFLVVPFRSPVESATRIVPGLPPHSQPEQKKETIRKKTQHQDKTSPKKPSDAVVWPCRINGCNKQFAREADLKRHQRTTKLHSVPGFACPQCDARFTRTDALRRHQKSRHNGVVIEPTDGVDKPASTVDGEPHSSASRSKSRSRSPSSKDNPVAPPCFPPSTAPPGAPQGYYRQHTFPGVMIPPPGVMVDGHYPSPVGLPMSATRLHQATWPPAPPWGPDGSHPPPPHLIHPGYPHPYYNAPPHFYRPGVVVHDAVPIPNSVGSSSNGESSSSRNSSPVLAVDPSLDHAGIDDPSDTGDIEDTVIDPSLVSPAASNTANGERSANGLVSGIPETRSPHVPSPNSGEPINKEENDTDSETTIVGRLLSPHQAHPYSPHSASLERPLEMEQILTEDGEPMLNPAELLTQVSATKATSADLDLMFQFLRQESLASPPPS